MLRRIFLVAMIAGAVAGLAASILQAAKLWPLIAAAEQYEQAAQAAHVHGPGAAAHEHGDEWEPADGAERMGLTLLFNILIGFGFALLLNGAMALRAAVAGAQPFGLGAGALWGLAGFVCFALAPGLGLPPELPGMQAAELLDRQLWWVGTALASAVGLALVAFGHGFAWKSLGLLALVAPHLVSVPHPDTFGNVPGELAAQFVAGSLIAAALFWLVLGGVSGWLHRRLA